MPERSAENIEGNGERVFELRDISVRFPPGELTVVTGPTASGKTALLVRHLRITLSLSLSYVV